MRFLPDLNRQRKTGTDLPLSLFDLGEPVKREVLPLKPDVSPDDQAVKELEASLLSRKSDPQVETQLPEQLSRMRSLPTLEFDGERFVLVRPGELTQTKAPTEAPEMLSLPERTLGEILPPRPALDQPDQGSEAPEIYEGPTFSVDVYAEAPEDSEDFPAEASIVVVEESSPEEDVPTFRVDVYAKEIEEEHSVSTALTQETQEPDNAVTEVIAEEEIESQNEEVLRGAPAGEEPSAPTEANHQVVEEDKAEAVNAESLTESTDFDFEDWLELLGYSEEEDERATTDEQASETETEEWEEAEWEPEMCEEACEEAGEQAEHTSVEISAVVSGIVSGSLSTEQAENALHQIEEEIRDLQNCGPEAQSQKEQLKNAASALRVAIARRREEESAEKKANDSDRGVGAVPWQTVEPSE